MGGSGVNTGQGEAIGPDGMTDSVRALTQKNGWEVITRAEDYNDFLGSTPNLSGSYVEKTSMYNSWKNKQIASNKDHQTYLDAVKGSPGRQGTILVPVDNADDPTILTGNTKKPKTVLG